MDNWIDLNKYGIYERRNFICWEQKDVQDVVEMEENILCNVLEENELEVKGVLFAKQMTAKKLLVRGLLVIEEQLDVDEIVVRGSLFCKGLLTCGKLQIHGFVKLDSDAKVQNEIKIQGKLISEKTLKTDNIYILGSCNIKQLEAKRVDIHKDKLDNQSIVCNNLVTYDE